MAEINKKYELANIPVDRIAQPRRQIRRQSDPRGLERLAASIAKHGLIEPVVVRKTAKGYEIVAGIRRLLACKQIGLKEIPAVIRDVTEAEGAEINVVENAVRTGFSPIEKAEIATGKHGLATAAKKEEIVELLDVKEGFSTLAAKLCALPIVLKEAVAMEIVSPEMAVELSKIADNRTLLDAVARIHSEGLSLNEVKLLVTKLTVVPLAPAENPRRKKSVSSIALVRLLLRKLSRSELLDLDILRGITIGLADQLSAEGPYPFLDLSYRGAGKGFLHRHAINIAKLALYVGKNYGYGRSDLEILASAALLCDAGMMKLPHAIFEKPGALSPKEWSEVKRHPEYGILLLTKKSMIGEPLARAIMEHHERPDGSGYPRGLKGDEIHTFAKIVAIADAFEAMVSPRPYKKALLARDAMARLIDEAEKGKMDKGVMKIFSRCMSLFPIGSFVRIGAAEIGVVVKANPDDAGRPVVKVSFDGEGRPLKRARIVDLAGEGSGLAVEAVALTADDSEGQR